MPHLGIKVLQSSSLIIVNYSYMLRHVNMFCGEMGKERMEGKEWRRRMIKVHY